MLRRMLGYLVARRRRAIGVLGLVALASVIAAFISAPAPLDERLRAIALSVPCALFGFLGGFFVLFLQVKNLFAPKALVGGFTLLAVSFFGLTSVWFMIRLMCGGARDPFEGTAVAAGTGFCVAAFEVWRKYFHDASSTGVDEVGNLTRPLG